VTDTAPWDVTPETNVGDLPDTKPKRKRGRAKGEKVIRRRALIPTDMMQVQDMDPEEAGVYRRRRSVSDPEVKAQEDAFEVLILDVYDQWVNAGRPSWGPQMPIKIWPCDVNSENDVMFNLRKACTRHYKKLVTGDIKRHEDGGVEIPFCIIARPVRNGDSPPEETE
jgi:hypothetical protein